MMYIFHKIFLQIFLIKNLLVNKRKGEFMDLTVVFIEFALFFFLIHYISNVKIIRKGWFYSENFCINLQCISAMNFYILIL